MHQPDSSLEAAAPLVVIGMHRSGTSMLIRLLERLGLFVGAHRPGGNDEAQFFVALNRWLMRQAGGDWDHPAPVRDLLRERESRDAVAVFFRRILRSPRLADFTGTKRFLRARAPWATGTPWGWKDPRNTFTLPVWLDVFPRARVLHIVRNGVDVAESLRTRENRVYSPEARRRRLAVPSGIRGVWPRLRRDRFAGSPRCRSLEGGFSLWEEYLEEARSHVASLGDRAMEFRYEEFVAEPAPSLARIARFAGLPADRDRIASATADVRPSRGEAWREVPALVEFAAERSEALARYGYAAGGGELR